MDIIVRGVVGWIAANIDLIGLLVDPDVVDLDKRTPFSNTIPNDKMLLLGSSLHTFIKAGMTNLSKSGLPNCGDMPKFRMAYLEDGPVSA